MLDCPFALAFAYFVGSTAQPLASYHGGAPLAEIATGPGFTCRHRNNAQTGRLSEHAFGNAIDIVAFKFEDGQAFSVKAETLLPSPLDRFQKTLRKTACGFFTTVLGPGSNAAHETHLHLDLGRMNTARDKKNPFRICE